MKRNTNFSSIRQKFEEAASANVRDPGEGGIYREEQTGASPASLLHTNTGETKVLHKDEDENIFKQHSNDIDEEWTRENNTVEGYVSTTTANNRLAQKSILRTETTYFIAVVTSSGTRKVGLQKKKLDANFKAKMLLTCHRNRVRDQSHG